MDDQFNGSPLDEIQWREPAAVDFFGGIKAENVHLYFMASPFCLATSNNKMLENQAKFNPDYNPILANRFEFEKRLKEMSGLEYLIVDGPDRTTPTMNPVWTVRKQRRSKNPERAVVLGTYYVVAENIYQAPTLFDVLSCRLLTIEQNMKKLYDSAASMQYFTPAEGYRYFPPSQTGKPSTRPPTREATPMPGALLSQQNTQPKGAATAAQEPHIKDENLLLKSLNLSVRYAGEFLDTNPLLGEPGSLVFTSTESHLQAQAAQAAQAKAKALAEKTARESRSATNSAMPSPMTDPKPLATRKASKAEKTTAGSSKLKRRRSKMTGSPEDTTGT